MGGYIYDAAWEQEGERLRGLEAAADPATLAAFDRIGVAAGWRCLEVGAGGGSITAALAGLVGPRGAVTAVDLDTRFVEGLAAGNVTVHRLDITTDPVPGGPFDLVHARAVLEHLPAREAVLDTLVALLAPGGWLVVEDVDFLPALHGDAAQQRAPSPDAARRQAAMWRAIGTFMAGNGIDVEYGRVLPFRLAERGLTGVQATAAMQLSTPTSPAVAAARWSLEHLRAPLVDQGLLSADDVDMLRHDLQQPVGGWGPLMVTAWGRRPR